MQRVVFGFVLLARTLVSADAVCRDLQLKLLDSREPKSNKAVTFGY
jgi:hypothetical protein